MSDPVWNDLAAHVERMLSSLPASRLRKSMMREELLAHLLALYDEEVGQRGNETLALHEAKDRFGTPSDLSDDLLQSIPFSERVFGNLFPAKENSMWRWLLLVLGVIAILVGLGFVMPAVAHLRDQANEVGMAVALLTLGLVLTMGGLASLGYGIKALRTRSS
jgi:hypothetical protein